MANVPDDVRRFVLTSVPSVPYLEAMLQFHRMPEQHFSADALAARLYVGREQAAELLKQLAQAGIVSDAGEGKEAFAYAPGTPELATRIERLAHSYASDLIEITHLIHDSTKRNALRFADAFKFRKDR